MKKFIDNHAHLFFGTHLDNMRDCKNKKRNAWTPRPGEANNWAKLTDDNIREIRLLAATMTYKQIAEKFNITGPNVGFIINRKTWAHVA